MVATYTGDSQGDRAGHAGDLPDRHLPAQEGRRLPPLQALQRARLGPDHLRRGPPPARPGLPDHGRDPGPPPARPDGHPGPRGRPRGGRLQPDRPQEVRRPLARPRAEGLDRRGAAATRSGSACPATSRMEYAVAEWRDKFRLASENPVKDDLVELLLDRHDGPDDRVLIIGQYLKQLRRIAERFDLPLITGQTSNSEREDLYGQFRTRRDPPAGPLEGRQLRDRPARRQRDDPGLGHLRQPPGRGPAARPDPPAQGRRGRRPASTRW